MRRHLTSSSSLEMLRKEARRWLLAVRSNDRAALRRLHEAYPQRANTAPCLRDVQHALALEYGAISWQALRDQLLPVSSGNANSPELQASDIREYESLANDLLTAYESGNAGALQRVAAHYQRQFTWDDLRAWAWHRLYNVRHLKSMTISDAQTLIAREAGYGKWTTFVKSAAAGEPLLRVPYSIDYREKTIAPSRQLDENDWDRILSAAENQRISTINARGHMTDEVLKRLCRLDHVTTLRLGNSRQVTEDGLKHLAKMPQLEVLEIGGAVTDIALDTLKHLRELRSFQMCWQTGVSDVGIANLAYCDKLESVDLMGSTTGDGAIAALAGKTRLRRFKTGRNVTDAGLQQLHHLPVFKIWPGGKAKYSLMSADTEPNHLVIDGPFTDKGVSALVGSNGSNGLEGLYGLSLFWHCTSVTPRCLTRLAEMPHLGFLGVDGKLCNDEAMRYIAALPYLKMLMAQGAVASDDGFSELSQSGTLEYIWGRECPNLTGRGFASLSKLRTLRGLAVSCKSVDDKALASLPEFPALRELMPMDVPDEGFRHVGGCRKLEELWCLYCRDTGDAATEHLMNMPKLKSYYAGATGITDRSLGILGRISSLQSIAFWECAGVTDDGLRLIAGLPRLRKVTLEGMAQVTEAGPTVFPARVHVKYSV